jgi:hypothetical protein
MTLPWVPAYQLAREPIARCTTVTLSAGAECWIRVHCQVRRPPRATVIQTKTGGHNLRRRLARAKLPKPILFATR